MFLIDETWFYKAEDTTLLGAGFGISRATAYRCNAEGIAVVPHNASTSTTPAASG